MRHEVGDAGHRFTRQSQDEFVALSASSRARFFELLASH